MGNTHGNVLEQIRNSCKKSFADEQRLFVFEDFIEQVGHEPKRYLRKATDWICDAFRYYDKINANGGTSLFKEHYADRFQPVYGQVDVQKKIRQNLEAFSKTGKSDKVLVLHGPNGSAKTTLCRNLFAALEKYSKTNEAALYTFSWVFPLLKMNKSMGLASAVANQSGSYALWP